MSTKKKTIILSGVFTFFLALSYFENTFFLSNARNVFANPPLAVIMVFLHNVIAVSLIIIGMSFYVEFVAAFPPKKEAEYAVLNHPRLFAIIFTVIVLIVSVLRVNAFLSKRTVMDIIAVVMLISLPHGIVEAYGIYSSIHKTLTKSLTNKSLATIYLIFLLAAILEVGFIQTLVRFAA